MSTDRSSRDKTGPQTKVIHVSRRLNRTQAVSAPIWQTTSFESESAAAFAESAQTAQPSEYYTRYGNPTHQQVETTLAELEGAEAALVTGSGMGAIFTSVMSLLGKGDHVVAQRNVYASAATLFGELLPRWGTEATFVDQTQPQHFADAIRPETKLIYLETPANPLMRLTNLSAVAEIARSRGILTIIDNTFATP